MFLIRHPHLPSFLPTVLGVYLAGTEIPRGALDTLVGCVCSLYKPVFSNLINKRRITGPYVKVRRKTQLYL